MLPQEHGRPALALAGQSFGNTFTGGYVTEGSFIGFSAMQNLMRKTGVLCGLA